MPRRSVTAGLLAAALLTGCYASTEPATEVGPESAKLNARGSADHDDTRSWFQYEVTGRVGDPLTAGERFWPTGVSGPFSHTLTGLSANSTYEFRVCGSDAQTPDVCAQTRTFRTGPATEDSAHGGWWAGCCASISVDARSGPAGQNLRGSMHWRFGNSFSPESTSYSGFVTCMEVEGRRAVIGSVGQRTDEPGARKSTASMLMEVVDGVTQLDTFDPVGLTPGSTPPDCENAQFGPPSTAQSWFEFVVNDATP